LTAPTLDPRRHAFRADLAAESLRGRVAVPRYARGETRQVVHPATPLRGRPDAREIWTTEALYGELVTVYDEHDGWAWVQLQHDGYVGYMRANALSAQVTQPTHRVKQLGTFLFPSPDVKASPWMQLTLNARLAVAEMGMPFARLGDGSYVAARHLAEPGRFAKDFVAVAEQFIGAPYLWGGKTRLGLDCSGLVQTALHAAGIDCPRDSDMQQAELGLPVEAAKDLAGLDRGDLVFWKGHVGIMVDGFLLLHANAHHMAVVLESLGAAVDRHARAGLAVTSVRRLARKSA
jgi:cell wall-associated NlpC family hydrolase